MMVETNNDPAAGIIKAIATPVTTLNKIDMVRTGSPSTKAVSSSKVKIYIGRKNKAVSTNTTKAITNKAITCSSVMVRVEPNKY